MSGLFDDVLDPAKPAADAAPAEQPASRGLFDDVLKPATPAPTLTRGTPVSQDGDFMRGLKRTLPEAKQLIGGTAALVGDTVGWDGLRDKGLKLYHDQEQKLEPLQKPTDSASEAWKQVKQGNLGAGVDFVQNAAGYTAGQALESLAAAGAGAAVGGIAGSEVPVAGNAAGAVLGGVGGFVAKNTLKRGVKAAAEKLVEEQVAKGVAKDVAKKEAADFVAQNTTKAALKEQVGKAYTERELAKLGGAAAGGALGANAMNATMELGSIYPEAVDQAQQDGRQLNGGDLARVWGTGLAAAGMETVADMINVGKLFGGVKDAATEAAATGFKAAAKRYAARAAREGGEAALREAGTEGVQTELERAGARQSLTDADAMRDVIDSMAVGAVGGVFFGGAAALHPQGENEKQKASLKRGQPLGADPADPLRAAVLHAQASGDANALQRAHGALVSYLEQNGRMLPGPTISVDSQGNASTPAQREAGVRAGLPAQDPLVSRGSLGDSPDVQAAAPAHPGFAARFVPPYPGAKAGSLAGAVNDVAAGTAPAPTAAPVDPKAQALARLTEFQRQANGAAIQPDTQAGNEFQRILADARAHGATDDELAAATDAAKAPTAPAYTRDQAKTVLAGQLAHGGPSSLPDTGRIASTFGMNRRDADELRLEVLREHKTGTAAPVHDAAQIAEWGNYLADQMQGGRPAPEVGDLAEAWGIPATSAQAVIDHAQAKVQTAPIGSLADAADTTETHAPTPAAVPAAEALSQGPDTSTTAPVALAGEDGLAQATPEHASVPGSTPAAGPASEGQAASPSAQDAAGPGQDEVTAAAHEAATSDLNALPAPTEAQKEAGNYKKGHVKIAGLDVSIENPAGSKRNEAWPALAHHYGYIKGTVGKDKDHVDVFLTPHAGDTSRPVFVVDQHNADGGFDEHKVVLGAQTADEARAAYKANYSADWNGDGHVTQMTHAEFEQWVRDPNATQRPAAEAMPERATPRPSAESPAAQAAPAQAPAPAPAPSEASSAAAPASADTADQADTGSGAAASPSANATAGPDRFAPKGKKAERGYGKPDSVRAELEKAGLNPDDYTIERTKEGGYVGVRKGATEAKAEAPKKGEALASATAPEHVASGEPGVSVPELKEMAKEWRSYIDAGGTEVEHHLFDTTPKNEVVRLADKVKVYVKDHGWMTPNEAKARIAEWKAHAAAQGQDPEIRSANSQKVVLSLFDLTGAWSQPWEDAGYQVYRFDIQDGATYEHEDPETGEVTERNAGDVRNLDPEFFIDMFGMFEGADIHAILAACPCTDFAVSGARHFAAKDADGRTVSSVELVQHTLALIEYFKPAAWAIENPVGRIEDLTGLPPWRLSFDPNHLGDPYTKKTLLWGRFNGDLPIAPVEPTEGSKMHKLYGGKSLKTKNARSETPEGFSYGFFMANNAHDNPLVAVAGKYDRLDRNVIAKALDAGITPEEIDGLVEDYYYQDLDDDAANDALRDATAERLGDAEAPTELAKGDPVTFVRGRFKGRQGRVLFQKGGMVNVEFLDGQGIPRSEMGVQSVPRGELAPAAEYNDGATTTARKEAERAASPTAGVKAAADEAASQPTSEAPAKSRVQAAKDKVMALRAKIVKLQNGLADSALSPEVREQLFRARGQLKNAEAQLRTERANAFGDEPATEAPKGPRVIAQSVGVDGLTDDERAAGKAPIATLEEVRAAVDRLREKAGEAKLKADRDPLLERLRAAESIARGMANEGRQVPEGWTATFRANHGTGQGDWDVTTPDGKRFNVVASTTAAEADVVAQAQQQAPKADKAKLIPTRREDGSVEYRVAPVSHEPDNTQAPEARHVGTESGNAAGEPAGVPAGRDGGAAGDAAARAGNREPVDAGVAGEGEGPAGSGDLFAGAQGAGGERAGSAGDGAERDASGAPRAAAGQRADDGATGGVSDFDLAGEDIGTGGLATKYRDNVAAIRIIKALEAEGRTSTPEERKQLARYVGWGALKGVFDPANKQWAKQHAELKELLTPEEFAAARASTRNAHFTSKEVVAPMIAALQRLGFARGRLLEPSVGTGNFFGMMPAQLRAGAKLFGVELDPLTAKIAAGLYPSAQITNSGFEDYQVPGGFFDAAIGNPPFGEEPIRDHDRSPYSGFSIHNYFLAKTIDKLRPGGVALMVVSHNFLDAKDSRARKWIADRASLIGAVRLPDNAFKANAGTEVVTDVLVFQKHDENGLPADDRAWVEAGQQTLENPKTGESSQHNVSGYFLAHPENVLGTPTAGGTMYGPNQYTVKAAGEVGQQLTDWVHRLPVNLYQPIDRTDDMQAAEVPDGIKVGSYYVDANGAIQQRGEDLAGKRTASAWVPPNAKAEERMRGMIAVRDALRAQMRLERDPMAPADAIEANRQALNKAYDGFLAKLGYLNAPTNRRLFLDDTDSDLIQALEFDYDNGVSKARAEKEGIEARGPSAVKADIFRQRVAFPPNDMQHVTSAKDALVASLNYRGRIDPAYMAQVYGQDADAIVKELGDLVYQTPDGNLETADAYLSGDVKTKLAEAEAAAKGDAAFKRNVEALRKVIPADKTPSEISVQLGAHFVPGNVISDFIEHITGAKVSAAYVPSLGRWLMHRGTAADAVRNSQTWGTPHYGAEDLIHATIDGKAVVVTKRVKDGEREYTVVLEAETEAAREKQNAIKAEWKSWLWRDPERAEKVLGEYNDKMNRTVGRKYDGAHLTLPGKNPGITLLKHQLDGIWRGIQSRQILLDHVVGAGKTFQIVGMVMEMRRLGIARKPLLAVPNHLTLQWRSEFTRLYPGARVLAATPDDFTKENRPKLFSKIVTGDWDAVILGHSSLKKIGLPPETEAAIVKEQIDELAQSIEAMKRERGDRNIIRDMEGIKRNLEAKMKERLAKAGARDKVLTFDELGLDALGIDELHEFKNLAYTSTMTKVPGMGNPKGSARAFDLFVKTQWLFNTYGDQAPLITATGTPVSNSLVEMFNVQRYMQYPRLKREGLHLFDSWARAYGSVEGVYEVAPSGTGFRASNRFAKFQNLPSLMGSYLDFADVITLDDLKAQEEAQGKTFPVPKIKGGRPQLVVAPRSPQVANFMGIPRLDRGEDGKPQFRYNPAVDGVKVEKVKDSDKVTATILRTVDGQVIASDTLGTYENREEANAALVEAALTPLITLDPDSLLGRFGRLRELTRETKGKVNALSLTGEANKAGLDYRLIDPTAPDFPDSKINKAVANVVAEYKAWSKDKGTQLVFCDMSVPLSARAALANQAKRAYVRDADGQLVHKRATLHTVEGAEELPYLLVETPKSKDRPASFAVYDAATGHLMKDGIVGNRGVAKNWAEERLKGQAAREAWMVARGKTPELTQDEIDDYNDANEIDPTESESVTLQDIAGVSGNSKFSVYDDMKAKLIAAGIPEREIAFIHDYDTPTAKAKLFRQVNNGEVRVLFGSTPKMGAGTNVQKRAVALHHIDAPWKPSDLEQREGRVIRRDNMLRDRDPDNFAVGIYRYATEQTYDARRWQILEHKARGIEQLRNYDGTLNEIEDIDGEAANAADMKAAASGDPLILRETQLRNDVKRLENLEVAHADNVVAARRAATRQQEMADKTLPRQLATVKRLLAARTPAVEEGVPKQSDVNGKTYPDKKEFTQAIARMVGAFAKELNAGNDVRDLTIRWRGLEFSVTAGAFGGQVHVDSELGEVLSFGSKYAADFSASGLVTRMNNLADRLEALQADTERKIQQAKDDAARYTAEAAKPFAEADDLVQARKDFKAVQRVLMLKGPQLQATDKAALEKALAEQRDALRGAKLGDALDELIAARGDDEAKFSRPDPARTLGPGAWFKQSKVVNERGAPLVVHHGTAEEFGVFEDRAGEASLHASSGLGFFFAEDKPVAQYYAETASRGVPADERIVDAYLSIQNPKKLSLEDMQAFDHVDEARAFRAHLERQGYDGIHVPKSGIWIAFKPNQIKSAFENNGDFDPANPDIHYSQPGAPITGGGMKPMELARLVGDMTKHWGPSAPKVYVLADASTLPTAAKRSQGWEAAEGFYDDRTGGVYLIASNLANADRARAVLLHEAVGHYGIEQIVGPVEWAKIADTIRAMRASGKHADLFAELGRRYAGANEAIFVREAVAVMTEKGVENSLVDRIVAAVRKFLRGLGMNLRLSEAELRQLIVSAARYVRDGSRPQQSAAAQRTEQALLSRKAGTFYSALAESIERAQGAPKAATAVDWRGWLDGAQRRGEFRQSERDWLGLDAWLNGQRGKITRQQLADYVRANEVQVQDVVLGDPAAKAQTKSERDRAATAAKERLARAGFTFEEGDFGTIVLDRFGDAVGPFTMHLTEAQAADVQTIEDAESTGERANDTRYSTYTLPGGANYRELLLTLPRRQATPTVEGAEHVKGEDYDSWRVTLRLADGQPFVSNVDGDLSREDAIDTALRAADGHDMNRGDDYITNHFPGVANPVAHVRFNDRVDADGKRVLFLEEIQSDWHQAGRRRGYRGENRTKEAIQADIDGLLGELRDRTGHYSVRDGDWEAHPDLLAKFNALHAEALEARSTSRESVPDAPFKATDEWAMLAFKRMVRYAAEHGYDRIAWTTGAQQAERYDLSKQVSSITVGTKNASTDRVVYIEFKHGDDLRLNVDEHGVVAESRASQFVGKPLDEVVGKEIAEKIMAKYEPMNLSGDGLKVGGEGMRGFYDKILPAAVNKWAKRFGAKVGTASIETGQSKLKALRVTGNANDGFYIEGSNAADNITAAAQLAMGPFDTYEQAHAELWALSRGVTPQHAIDLTPAMRDAALQGQPLFSRPDPQATRAAVDAASVPPPSLVERVKEAFGGLRENSRPAWLGALTLRHLAELGKDIGLKQVGAYADRVQQMATDRNVMQEEAAAVADPWAKFQRQDRAGADATANLMHDTTIEGVDPSTDYRPLRTGTTRRGPDEAVTRESIARRIEQVEKDLDRTSNEAAQMRLEGEIGNLKALLEREEARKAAYPRLVQRYLALPEQGRTLYVAARDAYTKQSDRLEAAIIERILATGADGRTQQEAIAKLRAQFEANRLEGPYFPLQRFGEFWISATAKDGAPFFSMYENVQEWNRAQRELAASGFAIKAAGRKIAESRGVAGVSQGFMADLDKLLDSAGIDSGTRDEVWQLFLRSLPDMSMRKHSIHRKKTAGYSKDALRAFASNMFHGSFQIARVRHTHQLEAKLLAMKEATAALSETDPQKAIKAAALTGEVNQRHEWVMNPKDSKTVSKLTGLGFLWYLGATPASALTNLTQTAIVTLPVLSARFGAGKSASALTNGMARALRNIDGDLTRGLTDEEKAAFKVWHDSGAIDRTAASGLAGLAETDSSTFNPVARRTMQVVSWLFHHTEMVNREATALAAFRLAREAGDDFATATKYAADVITESHFDYTNANRARFMQGNAAKVLLLFRQYSLNMTWLLWRNAYLGLRGETPEVRKAARVKLAGVTGMTALFAGTMGLPLMSVMFGIANAAAAAFGDDEDPWDAEVAFRNFLADHLGGALAHAVTDGPVSTLTGADIGSRVSLNDLWLHDPDRELEGQAKADYLLEQAAGPVAGGMLVNTLRGWQLMEQGNVERGIETMAPKAIKDGMKALRFATQGVTTLRGDPLIDDLGVGGVALQLAGFSPTSLAQRYDANNAAKNYERGMLDRRQALLDAYALAWRADDGDTLGKVRDKIVAWNDANPELGITMATIRSSLVDRVRYSARAEGGVVLDRRVAEKARAQSRFAE